MPDRVASTGDLGVASPEKRERVRSSPARSVAPRITTGVSHADSEIDLASWTARYVRSVLALEGISVPGAPALPEAS